MRCSVNPSELLNHGPRPDSALRHFHGSGRGEHEYRVCGGGGMTRDDNMNRHEARNPRRLHLVWESEKLQ